MARAAFRDDVVLGPIDTTQLPLLLPVPLLVRLHTHPPHGLAPPPATSSPTPPTRPHPSGRGVCGEEKGEGRGAGRGGRDVCGVWWGDRGAEGAGVCGSSVGVGLGGPGGGWVGGGAEVWGGFGFVVRVWSLPSLVPSSAHTNSGSLLAHAPPTAAAPPLGLTVVGARTARQAELAAGAAESAGSAGSAGSGASQRCGLNASASGPHTPLSRWRGQGVSLEAYAGHMERECGCGCGGIGLGVAVWGVTAQGLVLKEGVRGTPGWF